MLRVAKLLAVATFTAAVALTSFASAAEPGLAQMRDAVSGLETRAQAVRDRAERTNNPQLKKEVGRIVAFINGQRVFPSTRLQIIDLLGDPVPEVVTDTQKQVAKTDQLMATVDSWFRTR